MATPEIERLYGELAMRKDHVMQLAAVVAASDDFSMARHDTCFIGKAQVLAEGRGVPFGARDAWTSKDLFAWLNVDPGTLPLNGGALWGPGEAVFRNTDHPSFAFPEGVHGLHGITREHAVKMLTHFAETGEINWRT